MRLYQYRGSIEGRGFEYLRSLLENGDLKFTKPSEFNDPFDCCPTQFKDGPEGPFPHAVGDAMNRGVQDATSAVHGIACLSLHPDKMLMWSHYGDQHRSVCVGFESEVLLSNAPTNSEGHRLYNSISQVQYSNIRPSPGEESFTQKSEEWAYEDEYRIISSMKQGEPVWGPGVWQIPTDAIQEVVIGAGVLPDVERKIVALVHSTNSDISIKKAVLHMQRFELLIEPIEDQPNVRPMTGSVRNPNGEWKKI